MDYKAGAIGTFDGIHLGHKAVLTRLREYASEKGLQPVAITFNRHPLSLIEPQRAPHLLTSLEKKEAFLKASGITPIVIDFNDDVRSKSAFEWMKKLHDEDGVRVLVVGYDNTFGADGVNLSLEDYKEYGEKIGIEVITVDEIKDISSSAIRKAVAEGDTKMAMKMLGRPFSITSEVVKGNSLGHTFGFPTANLVPPCGLAIPKAGVYAAIVKLPESDEKIPSVVNIGNRPTVVGGKDIVIEAHLINRNVDLYNKEITVEFLDRLRDEQKFDSVESLKNQIKKDVDEAAEIAGNYLKSI